MKTMKILTIAGLMLLSINAFSQPSEKKGQPRPETMYAHCDKSVPVDNFYEIHEAFYSLRNFFNEQVEELKYDPNEFIEKENEMELEEWMTKIWNTNK